MPALRAGVLLCLTWAVLVLAILRRKTKAFGKRRLYAQPAGDPGRGAFYAFTGGMAPWAKESVMMNLPSYAAGLAFHAGVATAFVLLAATLLGLQPAGVWTLLARLLTLAGTAGGTALLLKRVVVPKLRGLSCPDDFAANLLTTLFVLLACGRTFSGAFVGIWLAEAMVLLVYLPLGKIRHCVFFFTTRYHMGTFFGRRGTFPPGGSYHA